MPIGKVTKTSESRFSVRFSATCLGLRSAVPSGSELFTILTVNVLPRLSMDLPGSAMSKTPDSSLVPLPTTLPDSSSTLILTPGTALAGVLRWSSRQPWMWMVSSLRGSGFTHVCAAAVRTGEAEAGALPVTTSADTTVPSSMTTTARITAEMLLGRACMGLLSLRHRPSPARSDAGTIATT